MPASVSVTDITLSSGSMSLLGSTKDYQGIADFLGALVACDLFGERPLLSYLTRGADGYRFALTVELMGGVTP